MTLISEVMPDFAAAILVAAIIGAIMSTADLPVIVTGALVSLLLYGPVSPNTPPSTRDPALDDVG